jgi:hypothetical protein
MSKYQLDGKRLVILHSQGLSNRVIAKELDVPRWHINRILPDYGLTSNIARGRPPKDLGSGFFECRVCLQPKIKEDFSLVKSKADGRRLSSCKKCTYEKSRLALESSPIRYWRDRQQKLSVHANTKDILFNLPKDYLFELWQKQQGICFYTDEEIELLLGQGLRRNSPSIDKLIPQRGYTVGNVVICTHRANSVKQDLTLVEIEAWLPGWYNRIQKVINE